LAAETDEALKEQDERLGKILGKLQVSLDVACLFDLKPQTFGYAESRNAVS